MACFKLRDMPFFRYNERWMHSYWLFTSAYSYLPIHIYLFTYAYSQMALRRVRRVVQKCPEKNQCKLPGNEEEEEEVFLADSFT